MDQSEQRPTVPKKRTTTRHSREELFQQLLDLPKEKRADALESVVSKETVEANTALRTVVEAAITKILEMVKTVKTVRGLEHAVCALVDASSSFSQLFDIQKRRTETFVNLLEDIQQKQISGMHVYQQMMTDSKYDYWKRAETVQINTFSEKQIRSIIDSIPEEEIRKNILISILYVFCEELGHFVQFNRLDNGENPFLSRAMEQTHLHSGDEKQEQQQIEADVACYLHEQSGAQFEASYWLQFHRKVYGDERNFLLSSAEI